MANTFLTPSVIAREALMLLESNMVMGNLVHRDHQAAFTGAKVGDTITIRQPASFTANEFVTTVTAQNATEQGVSLVLEKHYDVTFEVTSKDWTLELQDFSRQLIQPAVLAIAEGIDGYLCGKYVEVGNNQNDSATAASAVTLAKVAALDRVLNDAKVPIRPRNIVVSPSTKETLLGNVASFVEADKRGDAGTALRDASMGRYMGLDWYMDQNIKTHTADIGITGTVTVTGAEAVGDATINVTTAAGAAVDLAIGDSVTFAGDTTVYTATAAVTIGASTTGNIPIYPKLKVALSGSEAVSEALSTNHIANIAFHPNAIALAVVPLELPQGAGNASYVNDRGLGIRMVAGYDTSTKKDTISLDVLVGAKVQQPELAARWAGNTSW